MVIAALSGYVAAEAWLRGDVVFAMVSAVSLVVFLDAARRGAHRTRVALLACVGGGYWCVAALGNTARAEWFVAAMEAVIAVTFVRIWLMTRRSAPRA